MLQNSSRSILFLFLILVACTDQKPQTLDKNIDEPSTLYHNGDIITMVGDQAEYVEAVVEQEGNIVFVGTLSEAQKNYGIANKVDLNGATMLPAFLDGHGHVYFTGVVSLFANLLPPPDGPGADFNSIVQTMTEFNSSEDGQWASEKFKWIIGNGYDDSQLTEKDHPKSTDLDKISTELPVLIMHQSGHLGSINSKGLELMGWTAAETPNPEEGKLRRNADGTPNGVLEENAFFTVLFAVLNKLDPEVEAKAIKLGQEQYAQNGYLTAQEGRSTPEQVKSLERAAANGDLYIDIVSYPDMRMEGAYDLLSNGGHDDDHSYSNNFRVGGVKLTLDGSPQGKTAWLSKHYHVPPAGEDPDYHGYPIMSDSMANQYVEDAFKNQWQILCHTNGDAAIQQYLNAIEKAQAQYAYPDHRTVIIHGQTIREDQIERAASMGVDASLFPMHTFYWGDWHVESVLGHPRADYISPCRDALNAGLNITSHHDAPVTFPKSMRVLDATVNRTTRSGKVLGPDQKLTPYEGLKTLTDWAAYQYFEEETKGTLEVGKYADFVILERNPIKIDPIEINQITVLKSIRRGEVVFEKGN
ncbi:amidohydrolase [Cryomorphaceae bacterium 1068]|nr:amidohydrolase [Cryomorphaceae bacterium 1068]